MATEMIKDTIQGVKDAITGEAYPKVVPPQSQNQQPGIESKMTPEPVYDRDTYIGTGKLLNKVAIITGGDSGIGRSVATLFAKEGADVVINYLPSEQGDADKVYEIIKQHGRRCVLFPGDVKSSQMCTQLVARTIQEFGRLDILVNNAAIQHEQDDIMKITDEQIDETFKTNIYSHFYLTRAAMAHMKSGASIICTTSINAYRGHDTLLDYSSTKGAIIAFVRSLAKQVASKNIRVNAVAPGPIWTPLIPASFPAVKTATFGKDTLLGRPGQPVECATAYVFLASDDGSYFTGQCLHPNGGIVVNA